LIARRTFLAGTGAVLLAAPLAAEAQPAGKVWRIGVLAGGARTSDGGPPAALRHALAELGYVDGKTVTYVGRWAEAKRDRLPGLATELVDLKVEVIVTMGGPAAEAAKAATPTIPIVIASPGDAVATGLIARLARPGGTSPGSAIRLPS
jgi:putative ABC transport system substrate-binding protein